MTLKDRIKDDMKTAFKAGDQTTRGALNLFLSVLQNREIAKRSKSGSDVLTDEEVIEALGTEIKKRRESALTYESGGRSDLAEAERNEMNLLAKYMPEQMAEEDVKKMIAEGIASTGATTSKDMGRVMGAVAPKVKGRFDGARLGELVKAALGA